MYSKIACRWTRWQYAFITRFLRTTRPEKLTAISEKKALKIFHRAAETSQGYRQLLSQQGVNSDQIQVIDDFKKKVPIIDKKKLFHSHALRQLCMGGTFEAIRSFYSSSGSSGLFSFGLESWKSAREAGFGIEYLLDHYFGIFKKRTLLINCLPMGVTVPTRFLQIAETGVRLDVILSIIDKLKGDFEQFVLIGESPFLKELIDTGADQSFPWKEICIHIITGGEFIAENYRSYMGRQLGIDFENPETGMITVNMGLSEISLSLFRESRQTIQLRRIIFQNEALRRAFSIDSGCYCPLIMQFFPPQLFVETLPNDAGRPEIIITLLDKNARLPLVRYNTEDTGRLLSHDRMLSLLSQHGLMQLRPELPLPFLIISGKYQTIQSPDGRIISPNRIKEALYHEADAARALTGNFQIQKGEPLLHLLVQLRENHLPSRELQETISRSLGFYGSDEMAISLIPYHDFPHGMELSYEKKFKYIQ
jgi:phenylacetate-CoA ligase